jgi:monoterpene epsilon-lactone hydrolase
MASKELEQAIALERTLLQDFTALQTPQQFRACYSRFLGRFPTPDDVRFEPLQADGVSVEWMIPPGAAPARTVLYLHGGGYLIGSPIDYREMVPRIARAAQARALAVDYRLAPEHPHPAAVEDAVTAYRWLLANGGRPEQTVFAGDSAGGGLTVATLVALRDRGVPLPAAGVCICPWVDLEAGGASVEGNAASDPLVQKELLLNMAQGYLQGQDPRTPLAAPLYADLRGLPPLLIQVGSIETLLDDAVRLRERAQAAGVDVTFEAWEGTPHVWHWFGSFLPEARQAIERIGEFVRQRTSAVGVA